MEPTREEWKDWAAVMAAKEFDAETAISLATSNRKAPAHIIVCELVH